MRYAHNVVDLIGAKTFTEFVNLKLIDFEHNFISHVSPEAFTNLPISLINLNRNILPCVPDFTAIHCKTLTYLYINENRLFTCEEDTVYSVIFTQLSVLHITDNNLVNLPSIVYSSPNITGIDLKQNQFISLPDLAQLLPFMEVLRVNKNPLLCDSRLKWLKIVQDKIANSSLKSMICDAAGPNAEKKFEDVQLSGFIDPVSTTLSSELCVIDNHTNRTLDNEIRVCTLADTVIYHHMHVLLRIATYYYVLSVILRIIIQDFFFYMLQRFYIVFLINSLPVNRACETSPKSNRRTWTSSKESERV